jgi:hypothetical protein
LKYKSHFSRKNRALQNATKVKNIKNVETIQIWIREYAALSHYELSQKLKPINEQSVESFLTAIEKSSTDQTKQVISENWK